VAGEWVREVRDAEFEQVVSTAGGPLLVEFFATWCGACRRSAPVLEAVAGDFAGQVEAVNVNVEENPAVVARYGVSSTPTLVLFTAGTPGPRLVGAWRREVLVRWLEQDLARYEKSAEGSVTSSLSWAPVDVCTLPTAQQPLRVAEFGDLFVASLRGLERVSPTVLRLELDAAAEGRARELASRESRCCGFFTFTFDTATNGMLGLRVQVPAARVDVLDGLAAQARSARPA
jgi:thioredoxin